MVSCSLLQNLKNNTKSILVQGSVMESAYGVPIPSQIAIALDGMKIVKTETNREGFFEICVESRYRGAIVMVSISPKKSSGVLIEEAQGKHLEKKAFCTETEIFEITLASDTNLVNLKLSQCFIQGGKISD